MIAGPPELPPPISSAITRIAAGRSIAVVWRNDLGGLTFRIGDSADGCYVKWAANDSPVDLARERVRLEWAAPFITVPRVLEHGRDVDGSWLVTAVLPGENAVSARWKARPAQAAAAIGAGLRAFHEALPVATCPFSWSVAERLDEAWRRHALGQITPDLWHSSHRHLSVDEALTQLEVPPAIDQLVVCHGDTCAPNTLITENGRFSGHVDLGALGVADRWADLAIATWSTQWNYGPGWEGTVLDAYGVRPDPERMRYYRLLWDLMP